jgi:hypothetical protein
MISQAALAALKKRHPCDAVVDDWGVALRKRGKKFIGPCPLHSPDLRAADSTSFECDADHWVCASCHDGGDVIRLVMLRERVTFVRAIEILGGAVEPDVERAADLDRVQAGRRREQYANAFRERARRAAFTLWNAGSGWLGTPVEDYLRRCRGLENLPDQLPLRFGREIPFYHGEDVDELGRRSPRVIWRGPAMLAAIVNAAGTFRAVHITWINTELAGGKPIIVDPLSGETLPSKKVRGSKAGNTIRLVEPCPHLPASEKTYQTSQEQVSSVLYVGEGIETVLSVWLALKRGGRDLSRSFFWSSCDLGNLAGRAAESVPHPWLADTAGRARRVPGPKPDMSDPGIIFPADVSELVLLGDGDSDLYTTRRALGRAAARYARPNLIVTGAIADEGKDFNDELRQVA